MNVTTLPSTAARRRTWPRDVVVSVFLGLFMVVGTFGEAHHNARETIRQPDAGAVLLLLAVAASFLLRRRRPVALLAIVWGLTFVYVLVGYPAGPIWLGLILAYVAAVSRGHRLAGVVAALSGFVVLAWVNALLDRAKAPGLMAMSALAAWLLVLFGVGEAIRLRRQRAAEVARLAEEEQMRQASEERLRIARELHDVLAHNISLINVQAGVALHVNGELPEQARAALAAIKDASREALGELRTALDVLRQSGDAPPRGPAPGVEQVADLVAGARAAGLDVRLEVEGIPGDVPAPQGLAAYRVVQEALTNVIRHAGASRAWIRVTYAAAELRLRIEDDGRGPTVGETSGGGSGIAGMRERLAALGGELRTGPRPGGGFQVAARLPLPVPAASPAPSASVKEVRP